MQMNIEIGGRTEALDEGNGAGLGLSPREAGAFDDKGGEGAGDDPQHGRE